MDLSSFFFYFSGIAGDRNSLAEAFDSEKQSVKNLVKHFSLAKPGDIPPQFLPQQYMQNSGEAPPLSYLKAQAQSKDISHKEKTEIKTTGPKITKDPGEDTEERLKLFQRRGSLKDYLMMDFEDAKREQQQQQQATSILDPSAILQGCKPFVNPDRPPSRTSLRATTASPMPAYRSQYIAPRPFGSKARPSSLPRPSSRQNFTDNNIKSPSPVQPKVQDMTGQCLEQTKTMQTHTTSQITTTKQEHTSVQTHHEELLSAKKKEVELVYEQTRLAEEELKQLEALKQKQEEERLEREFQMQLEKMRQEEELEAQIKMEEEIKRQKEEEEQMRRKAEEKQRQLLAEKEERHRQEQLELQRKLQAEEEERQMKQQMEMQKRAAEEQRLQILKAEQEQQRLQAEREERERLRKEEQARQRQKAEADRRARIEEKKRIEQEKQRIIDHQRKIAEDKKRIDAERLRIEEEQRLLDEETRKIEELRLEMERNQKISPEHYYTCDVKVTASPLTLLQPEKKEISPEMYFTSDVKVCSSPYPSLQAKKHKSPEYYYTTDVKVSSSPFPSPLTVPNMRQMNNSPYNRASYHEESQNTMATVANNQLSNRHSMYESISSSSNYAMQSTTFQQQNISSIPTQAPHLQPLGGRADLTAQPDQDNDPSVSSL